MIPGTLPSLTALMHVPESFPSGLDWWTADLPSRSHRAPQSQGPALTQPGGAPSGVTFIPGSQCPSLSTEAGRLVWGVSQTRPTGSLFPEAVLAQRKSWPWQGLEGPALG